MSKGCGHKTERCTFKTRTGTFLVVQWLRLCLQCRGCGFDPCQRTKVPQAKVCNQKKKKKTRDRCNGFPAGGQWEVTLNVGHRVVNQIERAERLSGNRRDMRFGARQQCHHREGNGIPLQYTCLENPMDRGAC